MFGRIIVTEEQLQAAFALWHKIWKDSPEEFDDLDSLCPTEYSGVVTPYFIKLLKAVK